MAFNSLFASQIARFTDEGNLKQRFIQPPMASATITNSTIHNVFGGDSVLNDTASGGMAISSGSGAGINIALGSGGAGVTSGGDFNVASLARIVVLILLTIATKGATKPKLTAALKNTASKAAKSATSAIPKPPIKSADFAAQMSLNKVKSVASNSVKGLVNKMPGASTFKTLTKKLKLGKKDIIENQQSDTQQDQPPHWIILQSSNLKAVMYDTETAVMNVQFVSGAEYSYDDIPELVFATLLKASSHGSYFYWNIRGAGVPIPYTPPYNYQQIK